MAVSSSKSKKKSSSSSLSSPSSSVVKVDPSSDIPPVEDVVKEEATQNAEADAVPPSTSLVQAPAPEAQDPGIFNQAIFKAYNEDLDKEIKKGLALVYDRYVRLASQERPPDWEVAKDDLGNSSTWYENLFWSIKDGVEPGSKEDVYMKLATLNFTNMRRLDAIRQQYPLPG